MMGASFGDFRLYGVGFAYTVMTRSAVDSGLAQLRISSNKEFLSLWHCFSSSLSSTGWLRKAVVPVASFQEDSEIEWLWLDMWI